MMRPLLILASFPFLLPSAGAFAQQDSVPPADACTASPAAAYQDTFMRAVKEPNKRVQICGTNSLGKQECKPAGSWLQYGIGDHLQVKSEELRIKYACDVQNGVPFTKPVTPVVKGNLATFSILSLRPGMSGEDAFKVLASQGIKITTAGVVQTSQGVVQSPFQTEQSIHCPIVPHSPLAKCDLPPHLTHLWFSIFQPGPLSIQVDVDFVENTESATPPELLKSVHYAMMYGTDVGELRRFDEQVLERYGPPNHKDGHTSVWKSPGNSISLNSVNWLDYFGRDPGQSIYDLYLADSHLEALAERNRQTREKLNADAEKNAAKPVPF